jgi:hypothetical protein
MAEEMRIAEEEEASEQEGLMAVERYEVELGRDLHAYMKQTEDGTWVRYSDYAASEAKREEAERERDERQAEYFEEKQTRKEWATIAAEEKARADYGRTT